MVKRILLTLTFVATLAVAGLSATQSADAWGGCRRPWVSRYYGPAYYDAYVPYGTYYPAYYGPRYYSYGGPYYGNVYYPGSYYGYGRSGISVSFGF
jgi:hypothetical protein